MKWFTMFTSELITFWNRMSFDLPMAIKRGQFGKAVMELASLAAVGIGIGIASGMLRTEDDEERKEEAAKYVASQFVDAIPIVGNEISNALIFRRFYDQGVRLFPFMQYGLGAIVEATSDEPDAARAAEQAARAFMMATGLPMTATMRVKRAIEDEDAAALLGWR
jgi:hypothetical protein